MRLCEAHSITLAYIEREKPNQNAYIEHFSRSFREEVLDAWFSPRLPKCALSVTSGGTAAAPNGCTKASGTRPY